MTSHPKDLSDELIMAMKDCDKVCKSLIFLFKLEVVGYLKK